MIKVLIFGVYLVLLINAQEVSQEFCHLERILTDADPADDSDITEKEVLAGTTLKSNWNEENDRSTMTAESSEKFLSKRMAEPRIGNLVRRKEYRQLTKKELNIFHTGLKKMKKNGEYDRIANQHSFRLARAAHFGAAFLPWHREYLYIFEQTMRRLGKRFANVAIPFWDTSLDRLLPTSADSILWTDKFFGTRHGPVVEGKMGKKWIVTEPCRRFGKRLTRAVTGDPKFLYSHAKINKHLAKESLADFTIAGRYLPYSRFELDHGLIHCYVGECINRTCTGHIACVECSPNDPIFWLLHSFVDGFWDEWSSLPGKDNTYPEPGVKGATRYNLGGGKHLRDSPMSPFPNLLNSDGFSVGYYPGYEMRPSKIICYHDKDCRSRQGLIFCYGCQCISKIQVYGNCTGLPDRACYCEKGDGRPICNGGMCLCLNI